MYVKCEVRDKHGRIISTDTLEVTAPVNLSGLLRFYKSSDKKADQVILTIQGE